MRISDWSSDVCSSDLQGGGAAGHNGLRSIDAHLGKDYWRARVGIGHPGHHDRVTGWVLNDFAKSDEEWLTPLLDALADAAPMLAAGDTANFKNRLRTAARRVRERCVRNGRCRWGAV